VIASQFELHEVYGGVVPEIASRAHLRWILPIIRQALEQARISTTDLGAIAVASQPGLVGSLVIGLSAAKSLALVLGLPLITVDHLEAHLFACQLAWPESSIYPAVGLIVSGGHTSLYHCLAPLESTYLGGTRDDAAGEAFDKVSSLLGLGFPGGPAIERAARAGNPGAFLFPRAMIHEEHLDFSFSGLKTAVLYTLHGQAGVAHEARSVPPLDPPLLADLAASFQAAVIDTLVIRSRQALQRTGSRRLLVGGGVSANHAFREALQAMTSRLNVELILPPISLCTDNAAMIGGVAWLKWHAGLTSDLDADVHPGLVRIRS
jgi:N6-L-threonylcarbamoyladenine synthase